MMIKRSLVFDWRPGERLAERRRPDGGVAGAGAVRDAAGRPGPALGLRYDAVPGAGAGAGGVGRPRRRRQPVPGGGAAARENGRHARPAAAAGRPAAPRRRLQAVAGPPQRRPGRPHRRRPARRGAARRRHRLFRESSIELVVLSRLTVGSIG